MVKNTTLSPAEPIPDTEVLFREAERGLDLAFTAALPALSRNGVLWVDQSYRQHVVGASFSNQLAWRRVLTRSWNGTNGSACIVMEMSVLEPLETSWGMHMHWNTITLAEPRKFPDAAARKQGSHILETEMLASLEQFMFQHFRQEARRIGRDL